MPTLDLLRANLGIQDIMDSSLEQRMPAARPLASSVLTEAGLDEVYNTSRAERAIEAALCPPVGDGTLLQPEVFRRHLGDCLERMRNSKNPAVRAFVREDLRPLMENNALLNAYVGLMLGG